MRRMVLETRTGPGLLAAPLVSAGLLLGVGLSGFFDGIVLHQILQWHHMICATATCHVASVADLQRKDRQDGYFHLAVYLVTILGCVRLFQAGGIRGAQWGRSLFYGSVLFGWGLFDLVEGVIDHEILQIHHVRPGPQQGAWDIGFLIAAALIAALGAWLMRRPAAPSFAEAVPK